jgi:hypothetical protein
MMIKSAKIETFGVMSLFNGLIFHDILHKFKMF